MGGVLISISPIIAFLIVIGSAQGKENDPQCEFYGQHLPYPGDECKYRLCQYSQFALKSQVMRCPPGTSIDPGKLKQSGSTGEYPCTKSSKRCFLRPERENTDPRYQVKTADAFDYKSTYTVPKEKPIEDEPKQHARPYRYTYKTPENPAHKDYPSIRSKVDKPSLFESHEPRLPKAHLDYVHQEYPMEDVKAPRQDAKVTGAYTKQMASPGKASSVHVVHGYVPPKHGQVLQPIRYTRPLAGGKSVVTRDKKNPNKMKRITTMKKNGVNTVVEEMADKNEKKTPGGGKMMEKKMEITKTTKQKGKDGMTRMTKSFQYSEVKTQTSKKQGKAIQTPIILSKKGKQEAKVPGQKHIIHAPPSLYPNVPDYHAPKAYNIPAYKNPYSHDYQEPKKDKPEFHIKENGFSFNQKGKFPLEPKRKDNSHRGLFDLI